MGIRLLAGTHCCPNPTGLCSDRHSIRHSHKHSQQFHSIPITATFGYTDAIIANAFKTILFEKIIPNVSIVLSDERWLVWQFARVSHCLELFGTVWRQGLCFCLIANARRDCLNLSQTEAQALQSLNSIWVSIRAQSPVSVAQWSQLHSQHSEHSLRHKENVWSDLLREVCPQSWVWFGCSPDSLSYIDIWSSTPAVLWRRAHRLERHCTSLLIDRKQR